MTRGDEKVAGSTALIKTSDTLRYLNLRVGTYNSPKQNDVYETLKVAWIARKKNFKKQ